MADSISQQIADIGQLRQLSAQDAADVLNKSAFTFGDVKRDAEIKAFPFWYPIIPSPYHDYDVPPDFLCLPSPGRLTVPIVMGDDTQYKLLYIKYLVSAIPYNQPLCSPPFGARYQSTPPEVLQFHPHDLHRTWTEHVNVEAIVSSRKDTYLYGEPAKMNLGADDDVKIPALQGYHDGLGMIRTPWLVPKSGVIKIIFESKERQETAPNGYHVNGVLFGLKIYA